VENQSPAATEDDRKLKETKEEEEKEDDNGAAAADEAGGWGLGAWGGIGTDYLTKYMDTVTKVTNTAVESAKVRVSLL